VPESFVDLTEAVVSDVPSTEEEDRLKLSAGPNKLRSSRKSEEEAGPALPTERDQEPGRDAES